MDDTNKENGGLAVYPGSHHLGPLEDKGNVAGFYFTIVSSSEMSNFLLIFFK